MLLLTERGGCQRAPVPHVVPLVTADAGREAVALIPAARCGECHGKQEREWRRSTHARAESSPLYRAMRAAAPITARCDRCHAPLRAVAASETTADEAVSCDVCHTLASVQVGQLGGAGFVLQLEDNVRYGPLCDAAPHYFHTMGCSPLHSEGELCAACHDWRSELAAGGTINFSPTYSEWHEDRTAVSGQTCQLCHMKGERAEVAVGSPERPSVRSHEFPLRGALLGRALSGQATVTITASKLHVVVALTNRGVGHAVPSGLPERQLRVTVESLNDKGHVVAHAESFHGRLLVDANNHEVPFYQAVRQLADTRIAPGETRSDTFELDSADTSQLQITVVWRPISATLAAQLGVKPPPDEPMISGRLTLPRRSAREAVIVELRP